MEEQDELEYEEDHEGIAYQHPKVEKRFPRKLKKKIKKIPVGYDCYGSAIGDKGKMVNGKRVFKPIMCPFHQHHYCGLMMFRDDMLMDDFLKICDYEKYEYLAKPFPRNEYYYGWHWDNKIAAYTDSSIYAKEPIDIDAKKKYLRNIKRINNAVEERTKYLSAYRTALNNICSYIKRNDNSFERDNWDIHHCRIELPKYSEYAMGLLNSIYDDLYIAAHRHQNASAETIERGLNNADKLMNFLYPEI